MVETITPIGHGGRTKSYWTSVGLHALGATFAAALLGFALGAVGALLRAPWEGSGAVVIAVIALMYALREGLGLNIPLPDRHAQVPQWWRDFFSPVVTSFLYGAGLGVGFFTFLQFGTFVVVATGALISGDPLIGALLCVPFGLTRGLTVVLAAPARDPEYTVGLIDLLDHLGSTRWPRLANALVLSLVALVALVSI